MKLLKVLLGGTLFYVLMIGGGSQLSSCKKTVIEHDTTTIVKIDTLIKTDTLIKRDTLTLIDSLSELKKDMVAYYNFNGGNLNDSSGNNNNIVFNNAIKTTDRFGRANNAYLFDGVSSYMRVANSASLSPTNITMFAIVKFNGFYQGADHANQIFMKGPADQANGVYGLRGQPSTGDCCTVGAADTTKEVFSGIYSDGSAISATDLSYFIRTTKWVAVAFTYDGYQGRIFIDGVQKAIMNGSPVFTPNSNDLYIGKTENPTFPYLFNGAIDEIRIYNKALCPDDIRLLSTLTQ